MCPKVVDCGSRSTGPKVPMPTAPASFPRNAIAAATVSSGEPVGIVVSRMSPGTVPKAQTNFVPPASIAPRIPFTIAEDQYSTLRYRLL